MSCSIQLDRLRPSLSAFARAQSRKDTLREMLVCVLPGARCPCLLALAGLAVLAVLAVFVALVVLTVFFAGIIMSWLRCGIMRENSGVASSKRDFVGQSIPDAMSEDIKEA